MQTDAGTMAEIVDDTYWNMMISIGGISITPFITSIMVVVNSRGVDKKCASEIPNGKNGQLYSIV